MVDHAEQVQHAGRSEDGPPKPTASTKDRDRQKIISFKVTHVLLTTFLLWLMYVLTRYLSEQTVC